MSLDVYLLGETILFPCRCKHCEHDHFRNEENVLYNSNITHNLGAMAEEAGIYKHLWRPEEIGIVKAYQLIDPLKDGLELMKADRSRFEKHNAKNGWGLYEHFLPWVENYLSACEENPMAKVEVSR